MRALSAATIFLYVDRIIGLSFDRIVPAMDDVVVGGCTKQKESDPPVWRHCSRISDNSYNFN